MLPRRRCDSLFLFNDTATTEIYTLSLHDALPISTQYMATAVEWGGSQHKDLEVARLTMLRLKRSEEHTSELQSHLNLVCRLLLEKKKTTVRQTFCPTRR